MRRLLCRYAWVMGLGVLAPSAFGQVEHIVDDQRYAPQEVRQLLTRLYNINQEGKVVAAGLVNLEKYPYDSYIRETVIKSLGLLSRYNEIKSLLDSEEGRKLRPSPQCDAILGLAGAYGATGISDKDILDRLVGSGMGQTSWLSSVIGEKGPTIDRRVFWLLVCASLFAEPKSLVFEERAGKLAPQDSYVNERLAKTHRAHDRLAEEVACLKIAIKGAKGERKKAMEVEIAKSEKEIKTRAEYEEAVRKIREGGGGI